MTQQRHTRDTGDVVRPHLVPAQRLALGLCRGCGLTDRVLGARLLRLRLALALAHRLELKQLLEEHRDVARSGDLWRVYLPLLAPTRLTISNFASKIAFDALQVPCTPRHPPPPPLQRHVLPDRRTRINHGPQGPRHERQAVPEGSPVRMRLRDRRQVRVLSVCHALFAHLSPALPVPFFTAEVATGMFTGYIEPPHMRSRRRRLRRSCSLPNCHSSSAPRDPHGTP